MGNNFHRVTESDVAFATLQIAASQPNGIATFHRLKRDIPFILNLSRQDLKISVTRPNEAMWIQLIRNIKSHHESDGNFINRGLLIHIPRVGYKITDEGRDYLDANINDN